MRVSGEILPEDRVKLPPILGIRPGHYLAILYGLILLAVLFFLLLYPGLAKPGALVSFSSEPAGAAVRIDGLTLGRTPCEIFVPQGSRAVEMVLPGFHSFKAEQAVQGRAFLSLLLPKRLSIAGTLEAEDPLEPLRLGAERYAALSFAGEPAAGYQIPQELSEGAYRAGPAGADPAVKEAVDGILAASARFAATRAALRDLIRAKALADNGGLSPSPVTLLRSAGEALAYLSEAPGAAAWLADLLPGEEAGKITASAWYSKAGNAAPSPPLPSRRESPGALELGGMRFQEIAGDLFMALTETSPQSWAAFLEANPVQAAENAEENLEGLAGPPGLGGVSWYGAEAYCRWLTGLLPEAFSSYEVRLPFEAEWEYAAKLVLEGGPDAPPLEGLFDGRWEWCADPFAPLDFLPAPEQYIRAVSSPERSLRGGSWVNPPGSVGPGTRASLAPAARSAFVSFRPVIAPRKTL